MKKTSLRVWFVRFLFCVAVIATYKTLDNFSGIVAAFTFVIGILSPFIFGGVFGFFLFPPCKKVESLLMKSKKALIAKKARGMAVLIVVILFLALLTAMLWFLIPMIYKNLVVFVSALPGYLNDFYNFIQSNFGNVPWLAPVLDSIKNFFSFENMASSIDISSYATSLTNLFMTIFNLFIGFIISIYLLLERTKIKRFFVRVCRLSIKPYRTERTIGLITRVSKVIYSFVYGQALDAFLISCIVAVCLAIFQIPNSIVLGFIYFLFALIPYFGPFIGVACVSLFTFLSAGFEKFIIALIIVVILQQVDGNLLYPRVIGSAVGIRPLYVILGVTLFGGLFGFVGLFLGPPLMSILIELSQEFISNKEIAQKYKKQKQKEEALQTESLTDLSDLMQS